MRTGKRKGSRPESGEEIATEAAAICAHLAQQLSVRELNVAAHETQRGASWRWLFSGLHQRSRSVRCKPKRPEGCGQLRKPCVHIVENVRMGWDEEEPLIVAGKRILRAFIR